MLLEIQNIDVNILKDALLNGGKSLLPQRNMKTYSSAYLLYVSDKTDAMNMTIVE